MAHVNPSQRLRSGLLVTPVAACGVAAKAQGISRATPYKWLRRSGPKAQSAPTGPRALAPLLPRYGSQIDAGEELDIEKVQVKGVAVASGSPLQRGHRPAR